MVYLKTKYDPYCSQLVQFGCSPVVLIRIRQFCGLKVGILGTRFPQYLRVKGLQTGTFWSTCLPDSNKFLKFTSFCLLLLSPKGQNSVRSTQTTQITFMLADWLLDTLTVLSQIYTLCQTDLRLATSENIDCAYLGMSAYHSIPTQKN